MLELLVEFFRNCLNVIFSGPTRSIIFFEKFIELGFPDNRIEEWKYTNIKKIANEEYRISKNQEKLNVSDFTKYEPRIVLVNGRISKEMSSFSEKMYVQEK